MASVPPDIMEEERLSILPVAIAQKKAKIIIIGHI
jgi:hypothetical protein